uniref:Latrophilin-like protein 1 n=1 Tax=Caenorhabditis elegans TaxID=6239 RepID=UPI0031F5DB10
ADPTTDESGTISHTICDGEAAELSCPAGKVISIVLGNYGRFSVAVCLPDNDIVPSNINCQNHKTKSILEKKCNGDSMCYFTVDKKTFTEDPCPNTPKYLEVKYNCVVPHHHHHH